MKLSQAIREGRKQVARQGFSSYFQWDARYPRWELDKYPPNVACALGMALLGDGWNPGSFGYWNNSAAAHAAFLRWGDDPCEVVVTLNDKDRLRWDRIANRLEAKGW